jgi:excisionase family DNA binding protein
MASRTDLSIHPDLLTTHEVAHLLRLSEQRIRQMAADKSLRSHKVGNKWRFWRDDVTALLGDGPA